MNVALGPHEQGFNKRAKNIAGVAITTFRRPGWRSLLPGRHASQSRLWLVDLPGLPYCLARNSARRAHGNTCVGRGLRTTRRPFSSPAAAQFWFEWRSAGAVLPALVGGVIVVAIGPLVVGLG